MRLFTLPDNNLSFAEFQQFLLSIFITITASSTAEEDIEEESREFVADILDRRGLPSVGGLPHRWLELAGGTIIEPTAFEPDPRTHRHEYYYNVVQNRLFRRIFTDYRPEVGIIRAYWKPVSD